MNVIIVTAHADSGILDPEHIRDTAKIANFINSTYIRKDIIQAGEGMGTITAKKIAGERTDTVTAESSLSIDVPKSGKITVETDLPSTVRVKSYAITICSDNMILYTAEMHYTIKKAEDRLNRLLSLGDQYVVRPVSSFLQSAFSYLKEVF